MPAFSVLEAVETSKGLLSAKRLAEILDLSPKTVYAMAARKEIPSLRLAGALKFDPRALSFWLRKKDPTLAAADRAAKAAA